MMSMINTDAFVDFTDFQVWTVTALSAVVVAVVVVVVGWWCVVVVSWITTSTKVWWRKSIV